MTVYEPTSDSLRQHAVPDWFHDAKFGIFVHWGLYSVPAWAPTGVWDGDFSKIDDLKSHNPYAEWYWNTLQFSDAPTRAFHDVAFGPEFGYADFAPRFRHASRGWDPERWSRLFQQAGARYAVLTTKHHDGFLLWPSRTPNPHQPAWHAGRDLVGEFAAAVRERGLRMGLYYSGGIDWTFGGLGVLNDDEVFDAIPQDAVYARYVDAHWRELIDRYQPAILWNDIGYPRAAEPLRLFADYYAAHPDGLVNDRFTTAGFDADQFFCDYATPEYSVMPDIQPLKWETTRGIGLSFGYNRLEDENEYLSAEALIHMLVDIVSKNGNLLLNVGPTADGRIPWLQVERLLALGAWLATNGEAIYGTRPWERAEGALRDGTPVRFTRKGDVVYAIVLGSPATERITLTRLRLERDATAHLLGHAAPLAWEQTENGLAITLPGPGTREPAIALRFSRAPEIALDSTAA